ncbi:hypothetical protein FDECE_10957 [Fusarium decemcellulare]|nr:hypothetical protein FDECE_10957 [Fusarium decemcellulare]
MPSLPSFPRRSRYLHPSSTLSVMLQTINDLLGRTPAGFGWALCALLPGFFYFCLRLLLPKPIPGIPYNVEAANSWLGDLPEFRAAPNRRTWWADQAVKHQSPLVQVFLRPFGRPWVFVADYYEAADICQRRTKDFDRSDVTISQFGGVAPGHHIVLRSSDPQFKKNKELVRDLMSANFLQEVSAPSIHEKFTTLIELWSRKLALSNGRPFEAADDIHNAALDIIMVASFGLDSDQTQLVKQLSHLKSKNTPGGDDDEFEFEPVPLDEELRSFTILADSISIAIRSPSPRIHHFLYRNLSSKMRRATAGRDALRNREVAKSVERRRSGHPERCALDNMLAREDVIADKEGRKPDYYSQTIMSEVRNNPPYPMYSSWANNLELLGYLVAGHETTSSALRWGTKYLTDDQRVQSLLRKALYDAHQQPMEEHRIPNVTEISKAHIPYLDAVIEEILRHARPAPVTNRQAMVDTQILGVHIPKGTIVGFMANGPGVMMPTVQVEDTKRSEMSRAHMKRVQPFDDTTVTDFLPERWLRTQTTEDGTEETVFDPNNGPVQGFGLGPRGCFGRKLAYLEMRIFFTMVLWEFHLEAIKPELAKHEESVSLTRTPKHVYVKLRRTDY